MASKLQLGYDDERFMTTVNQNFHCLICFNVLRDPVMCQRNQHYFCRGCITEHLGRNSRTCPTCADELSVGTLCDVPRIVKNYLDELNIRCDYYNRGCQEFVQLQNLKYHVAECGFTPVVCGNQGCGETISKIDLTYHENEQCEFRKSKCHNCGEISTKLTALGAKVGNLDTKMANVDRKMETMSTKMGNIDTKMKNIDTKMKDIHTKAGNTEKNLAVVNKKMANLEGRIANIDGRISNANKEIGNVETNLLKVNMKMDNVDRRMVNLQASVGTKFEAVNNEVREMTMRFDHLKEIVLGKIGSTGRHQEEITRDVSGKASYGGEKQHIIVAGGDWGSNSVEIFNCHQRLWSLLKPMPGKERCGAISFVYNNHVMVAGGICSGSVDEIIQMSVQPIPNRNCSWRNFAAQLPARMYGHSSVVYKDSLFITGGYNADQCVHSDCINQVQLKPPFTSILLCKMPEPRTNHNTVLYDERILIFGGRKTGHYKDNISSVVSYGIKEKKCHQLPQLPYHVSEMATIKWFENVVIIGGSDKDGKALNSVIIYNIMTGNSHMLPPMLHKRKGCMAVVIQNTIVVLGGRNERGNKLKSVEGFRFDRYTWEELPDMKEARHFATAVVI